MPTIFSALLASIVAIGVATGVTLYEQDRLAWSRDRTAGQAWARWVPILDRATIAPGWSGDAINLAALPGANAPGDLPRDNPRAGMRFASILVPPHGTEFSCPSIDPALYTCERVGVARLRPDPGVRAEALQRGATDAGLRQAIVARPDPGNPALLLQDLQAFGRHEAAIAGALGGVREGDVVTLPHLALTRLTRALHRRPLPGHPHLTRMEADLDMDGHDVVDVDTVQTTTAFVSGAAVVRMDVNADTIVTGHFDSTTTSPAERAEFGTPADGREALRADIVQFGSGTVECTGVPAGEICARAIDLQAGRLEVRSHVEVERGLTSGDAGTTVVRGTLTLGGTCHGCVPY